MANSRELVTVAGISYRQLDYWTRKGYITSRRKGSGSGYPRDYTDDELRVAVRMARLIDRGFTPKAAARIARVTPGRVHLGQGISLTLTDTEARRELVAS